MAAAIAATSAFHARADDRALACIQTHERGLDKMRASHLIDARSAFRGCAESACPEVVRQECEKLLVDVAERIPSVVFVARDERDQDLNDVRVELEHGVLANSLDGRATNLDPGAYAFRFRADDGRVVVREVVIQEGDKLRRVVARFPSSDEPAEARGGGVSAAAYVLGGIGVIAALGAGYTGWSTWKKEKDLRNTCSPKCDPSEVDDVRDRYVVTDVLLGVAVVSLGTGTYLWLSSEQPGEEVSHGRRGYSLGLRGSF